MILTIDIGNSNINFGVFEGREIRFVARIATDTAKTEFERSFKNYSSLKFA